MKATCDTILGKPLLRAKVAFPLCLVLGAVLLFGACSKKPDTAESGDLSGVYTLAMVDGNQVPTSVVHEGTSLQIRSGSFTIDADGTCSSKMVFVPPSGVEAVREVSATYTRDGARLVMKWKGAGTTTGSLADGTFTMNNEGMVLVYRK